MARAVWSGTISFGLLNVPVKMYSGVSEHRLHFRFIHEPDASPIGYEKFCKSEEKPVPDSEIVKAFEYEGEMVPMRDEDFESAAAESTQRTIDVRDFVPLEEIDPVYFERTYYLQPDEGSAGAYALLARAMSETGRAAIAKFVMRDRQNLACLRSHEGVLILERMHFADEIRSHEEHRPENARQPSDRELEIARALISELSAAFEPEQYEDSYRDALCEIIESRRHGEAREPAEVEHPKKQAPDLMAALEASLAEVRGDGGSRSSGNGNDPSEGGGRAALSALSKEELYERARSADISGRSEMSKDELVEALAGG